MTVQQASRTEHPKQPPCVVRDAISDTLLELPGKTAIHQNPKSIKVSRHLIAPLFQCFSPNIKCNPSKILNKQYCAISHSFAAATKPHRMPILCLHHSQKYNVSYKCLSQLRYQHRKQNAVMQTCLLAPTLGGTRKLKTRTYGIFPGIRR